MTALVQRRDYLAGQRRMIIARALMGSLAGAVPLPFVDDMAVTSVLGGGYKKIAAAHQVDVTPEAINILVHGSTKPPSVSSMAIAGVVARVATRAARRMMVAITAVNRARSAARTFVAMTLFDHYCAKLHTGLALDAGTATILREEIIKAMDNTPGALAFHPFRRGVLSAARATLRAPLELADIASGGRLRKMLASRSGASDVTEGVHVNDMELAMEEILADKTTFMSRAAAAVEAQLSSEINPFLDGAIESLDRRWRARVAAGKFGK